MNQEDGKLNLKAAGNRKQAKPVSILQSEWLLDGAREVWIAHYDQLYRLQTTKSGKLILTK